jgi:hypothetical protein
VRVTNESKFRNGPLLSLRAGAISSTKKGFHLLGAVAVGRRGRRSFSDTSFHRSHYTTNPSAPNTRKIGKMILIDSFQGIHERARHKGLGKPPPIVGAPPTCRCQDFRNQRRRRRPTTRNSDFRNPLLSTCKGRLHTHHIHQKLRFNIRRRSTWLQAADTDVTRARQIFLPRCPVSG